MTRFFWHLLPPALAAASGYAVWLFTHGILHVPTPLAGTAAVGSGLAVGLALHGLMAIARPDADEDPYTEQDKAVLNERYVPQALRKPLADSLTPDDEDTVVFDGRFFNLRRPSRTTVADDQTEVMNADRVYRYQGRRRSGAGDRS